MLKWRQQRRHNDESKVTNGPAPRLMRLCFCGAGLFNLSFKAPRTRNLTRLDSLETCPTVIFRMLRIIRPRRQARSRRIRKSSKRMKDTVEASTRLQGFISRYGATRLQRTRAKGCSVLGTRLRGVRSMPGCPQGRTSGAGNAWSTN